MLSRTADHLFWMSLYPGRAENHGAHAGRHQTMSLMPAIDEDCQSQLARSSP